MHLTNVFMLFAGHKGQMMVAKNFRLLTEGSEILKNCQSDRVQDAYSLRCIPQVHGATAMQSNM